MSWLGINIHNTSLRTDLIKIACKICYCINKNREAKLETQAKNSIFRYFQNPALWKRCPKKAWDSVSVIQSKNYFLNGTSRFLMNGQATLSLPEPPWHSGANLERKSAEKSLKGFTAWIQLLTKEESEGKSQVNRIGPSAFRTSTDYYRSVQ